VAPGALKYAVSSVAPQFGGYQQHDSQELLAFLLDGLHEDVNKVTSKPYVEVPSGKEGEDIDSVLAAAVWKAYSKRNDSIITELFQGQYRSRVQCVTAGCKHVSLTYDPYSFLSLPLPSVEKRLRFDCVVYNVAAAVKVAHAVRASQFSDSHAHLIPSAHSVLVPDRSTTRDALQALAKQAGFNAERLRIVKGLGSTCTIPLGAPAPLVPLNEGFGGDGSAKSQSSLVTSTSRCQVVVYLLPQYVLDAAAADLAQSSLRRTAAPKAAATKTESVNASSLSCEGHSSESFMARSNMIFGGLSKHTNSMGHIVPYGRRRELSSAPALHGSNIRRISFQPMQAQPLAVQQSKTPGLQPLLKPTVSSKSEAMDIAEGSTGSAGSCAAVENGEAPEAIKQHSICASVSCPAFQWRLVLVRVLHRQLPQAPMPQEALHHFPSNCESVGYPALLPVVTASHPVADAVFKAALPSCLQHLPRVCSQGQVVDLAMAWLKPLLAQKEALTGKQEPEIILAQNSSDHEAQQLGLPNTDNLSIWAALGCESGEEFHEPVSVESSAPLPSIRAGVFGSGLNGGQIRQLGDANRYFDESSDSDGVSSSEKGNSSCGLWKGLRSPASGTTLNFMWQAKKIPVLRGLLEPLLPGSSTQPKKAQQGSDAEDSAPVSSIWPSQLPVGEGSDTIMSSMLHSTGGISLTDCLQLWENEEELGQSDTWYCGDCKQHVRALKRLSLWSAPEYLMVHLKRFKFTAYSRARINTRVDFPVTGWDLEAHVLEPQAEVHNRGLIYDLYAVINHIGSMGGGHYTACAKHPFSGIWYDFDDSSVSVMGPSTSHRVQDRLTSSQAYVLFYARRVIDVDDSVK
jgi:ubiquitin C-terminal hydrolase